jgi:hypothetical protein
MNPHQPTPIGLSVRDAALLTSFGEKEIRDAVNRGEIPAIRRGTRIVIDYTGLVAWFRSNTPVVESA